jgi:hypothetical protein
MLCVDRILCNPHHSLLFLMAGNDSCSQKQPYYRESLQSSALNHPTRIAALKLVASSSFEPPGFPENF